MGIEFFVMRFIIEVYDIGTEIFMGSWPQKYRHMGITSFRHRTEKGDENILIILLGE
jgi:hypothetical protein